MGFDYRRLNIRREDGAWLCPSCGFAGHFDGGSFDENGPLIGTAICPCCLYEPGFDDVAAASGVEWAEPLDALREYARIWREGGKSWRGAASAKPPGWSAERQLDDWRRLVPSHLLERA